ncbi:MAG TPA: beta-N-acetylhexosaminidase [Candidatus Cloacimonadota bacterium]|nr:beta-N-acetylhexosaminidase [Candidatus Cloacimonadota bacterium]
MPDKPLRIIPQPLSCEEFSGYFVIDPETEIYCDLLNQRLMEVINFLTNPIKRTTELILPMKSNVTSEQNVILIKLAETGLGKEGYKLLITADRIELYAAAENGIFYGIQTLLQLLPVQIFGENRFAASLSVPCCRIEDKPRFNWRGMHLDVSRHFFGVDFIKKYLDLLALHKLNVFHWHLTDDNGWRIEIKKYPELTKTCAWRKNLEHLPWQERDNSADPGNGLYGGFYAQEEIKEIVQYAAERFISILPEIEMPGHSREVFAAYPQFSCRGKKLTVAPGSYWPNLDIFCAGKDDTFQFLKDILTEVIGLFPSEYIHIGGDEADKTRWQECPFCQQRIKDENLKDEKELQSWFMQQIADFLHSQNRKLIGWDEIAEGGLIENATVMCWRGDGKDAAKIAVQKGCEAIMCPNPVLYFDWKQNESDVGAFGVTTLQKVYEYDPIPPEFSPDEARFIIGAQGNVWTEWMPSHEKVEYMAFPRMSALAEVVWCVPNNKNYPDFKERLTRFSEIWRNKNVKFNKIY